ncbi:hypothetical protein K439DRAFT_1627809 [Ramaria rubella]|nr:hypothetical protein K439DRAFT_1627809 [Ramaria rubella]
MYDRQLVCVGAGSWGSCAPKLHFLAEVEDSSAETLSCGTRRETEQCHCKQAAERPTRLQC